MTFTIFVRIIRCYPELKDLTQSYLSIKFRWVLTTSWYSVGVANWWYVVVHITRHLSANNFVNFYPNYKARLRTDRSYLGLPLHKISMGFDYVLVFRWGGKLAVWVVHITLHLSAYNFVNFYPNYKARLRTDRSYLGLPPHIVSMGFDHILVFR
jgi:hypothetical protein